MLTIFFIIGIIIALTIHEFSHAYVADRLGDPTPRSYGRLTLNPLAHLDPLGTLMLFIARFGWGKPVPVDSYNLKNPKRDEILISLAGPLSNIILAFVLGLVNRFFPNLLFIIFPIISINLSLAVFNLLPIPPLDGSKIFLNLLPVDTATQWQEEITRFGPIILIALIFLPFAGGNLISLIISPVITGLLKLIL